MRHLTILVDMDDTIENLAEAWVAYLIEPVPALRILRIGIFQRQFRPLQKSKYRPLCLRMPFGAGSNQWKARQRRCKN